jgi:hypothetical protein
MATPNVTGIAANINEVWDGLCPSNPPTAATMKALLIHTANPVSTNPGPTFWGGYGLVSDTGAVALVRANFPGGVTNRAWWSLSCVKEMQINGGANAVVVPIAISAGQTGRVTIAWTDPPGQPLGRGDGTMLTNAMHTNVFLTASPLVNDLDLRVVSGGGVTKYPYILDPVNYTTPAQRGDDSLNNVEMVDVPGPGAFQVTVTTKAPPVNDQAQPAPQPCSMILSGCAVSPVPALQIFDSMYYWTPTNTSFIVKWASVEGGRYSVLGRDTLTSPWQVVASNIVASQTNCTAVVPTGGGTRFYTVRRDR